MEIIQEEEVPEEDFEDVDELMEIDQNIDDVVDEDEIEEMDEG